MRWARQMAPSTPDVFGCTPGDVNCGERAGPDFDFGASPVLATLPGGRDLIVAGQKSGVVYALDPDKKGEQVWRYRAGGGSGLGGIQWGIAADGERVYVPVAEIYNPTPGGLHADRSRDGDARLVRAAGSRRSAGSSSRACSGAQFSAVTAIPGIVFSPSNDGAIRAHSTADGTSRLDVRHQPRVPYDQRVAGERRVDERSRLRSWPAGWSTSARAMACSACGPEMCSWPSVLTTPNEV